MTAVGEVNERVTDLATTQRQETHELQHKAADVCRAWAHSKSRSQAIEAQIRALKRDVDKMPPKRTTATTTTPMTDATIKALIAQGVADDLA
ncbi:hypothetical protein Tco_0060996, partial [Tanacetum coccineum]